MTVTVESMERHETPVSLLGRRVGFQQLLKVVDRLAVLSVFLPCAGQGEQQAPMETCQNLAPRRGPFRVEILREERASIQGHGFHESPRIPVERRNRRLLELVGVDPDVPAVEGNEIMGGVHVYGLLPIPQVRLQRVPGHVHQLIELRSGAGERRFGPEKVRYLLTVERMARLNREQLDQRSGHRARPRVGRNGRPALLGAEAAEQVEAQLRHPGIRGRRRFLRHHLHHTIVPRLYNRALYTAEGANAVTKTERGSRELLGNR